MRKAEEYTDATISWKDGMRFWLDVLQKHLNESAHKESDAYGGLSFSDYFEEKVLTIADATDRANRVAREQEKESN